MFCVITSVQSAQYSTNPKKPNPSLKISLIESYSNDGAENNIFVIKKRESANPASHSQGYNCFKTLRAPTPNKYIKHF